MNDNSEIEITTCVYHGRERKILILTPELNGKTLRQILSKHCDDKNVIMIDIHDGHWHDDVEMNKILDTTYDHFGETFKKSNHTSINYMDILSASVISSAGGLRILSQ